MMVALLYTSSFPDAPEGPLPFHSLQPRHQGLMGPRDGVSSGALPHYGGLAVHVVRDLPAARLPGLLLRLQKAAI